MGRSLLDNPRQCCLMIWFIACGAWQTVPTFVALIVHTLLVQFKPFWWKKIALIGAIASLVAWLFFHLAVGEWQWGDIIHLGWQLNKNGWLVLFEQGGWASGRYLLTLPLFYYFLLSVPFTVLSVASLLQQIPLSKHEKTLKAMHQGQSEQRREISKKILQRKLTALNTARFHEAVLGLSCYTGQVLSLPDRYVNQLILILGTTGAGKTITLRRFYERAFLANYPLIITMTNWC